MIFKQAISIVIVASTLCMIAPTTMAQRRGVRGESSTRRDRKLQSSSQSAQFFAIKAPQAGIVRNAVDHRNKTITLAVPSCKPPAVFANMMTSDGSDTSDVRVHNVTIRRFTMFVQEEQSLDDETFHGRLEDVGYLAFGGSCGSTSQIVDRSNNIIGEVGHIPLAKTSTETFHDLNLKLEHAFDGPIVVLIAPNSLRGSDPFRIRVTSAEDASNIKFRLEEWSYLDQIHGPEDLVYLVLKVGTHRLANGKTLQGKIVNGVTDNFKRVAFGSLFRPLFRRTPVVLSQSQTLNGFHPIVTRMKEASRYGITIRVQEEEGSVDGGRHAFGESIGMVLYG